MQLSWHLKRIHKEVLISLQEEHRKRVKGYEVVTSSEEQQKLLRSFEDQQVCVRNHTNCVDFRKLGKSWWDQKMRGIYCVFCTMRCLYTPRCSVLLHYLCITVCLWKWCILVCPPQASPSQIQLRWWWVTDCLATKTFKCIPTFS